jgi:hypothetical protein
MDRDADDLAKEDHAGFEIDPPAGGYPTSIKTYRGKRMPGPERKAEDDIQEDPNQAHTRAEGGIPDPEKQDQGSTTGTTPSGSFVGRVAGDDVGYEGETGADRRGAAAAKENEVDKRGEESFPASDPPANY